VAAHRSTLPAAGAGHTKRHPAQSSVALVSCYAVLSNLQLARDRMALLVGIVGAGAVAKIACNAVLIPQYGARGAAATAVGVEARVVLAQWIAVRRNWRMEACGPGARGLSLRWAQWSAPDCYSTWAPAPRGRLR